MISDERGKGGIVITTNRTYPWTFVHLGCCLTVLVIAKYE